MKPISLRILKILKYIPYVNILCLFLCLYNSFFFRKQNNYVLNTLWILFSTAFPYFVIAKLFANSGAGFDLVIGLIGVYFVPLIIAFRLLNLQESQNDPK